MNIFEKDIAKGVAVFAGVALLAGCSKSDKDDGGGSVPPKWAMLVDLNKCIGCAACVMACKIENGTQHGVYWCNLHYKEEVGISAYSDKMQMRRKFRPYACHHCRNAECMKICPTGATHYLEDGTVTVDMDVCIGCHKCVDACPYQARMFNYKDPLKNPAYSIVEPYRSAEEILTPFEMRNASKHKFHTAEKCVFCKDRRAKGEQTACVETCPTRARVFGRIDDPESDLNKEITRLGAVPDLPDNGMNTGPSYYIAGKF